MNTRQFVDMLIENNGELPLTPSGVMPTAVRSGKGGWNGERPVLFVTFPVGTTLDQARKWALSAPEDNVNGRFDGYSLSLCQDPELLEIEEVKTTKRGVTFDIGPLV